MTRAEKNKRQREYRVRTKNGCTWKYEKTIDGFLMRAYRNMLSRTKGLVKPHLYKGLEILDKETFYAMSREDHNFLRLYRTWVESGYDRKLSPSVNRIDSRKGYTAENIEWLTHSANSSLSGLTKRSKNKVYQAIERLVNAA